MKQFETRHPIQLNSVAGLVVNQTDRTDGSSLLYKDKYRKQVFIQDQNLWFLEYWNPKKLERTISYHLE